jgi:hypothetical protein
LSSDKQKNVFISHYNKNDEHIQKLKNLLSTNNLQIKNSSIDSTKPNKASNEDYIKQLLRDRIKWAGTTNKVRLCERSEPQSEPFVGQARSSYIENSFLGGRPPGQTDERRGRFFFRKIDL